MRLALPASRVPRRPMHEGCDAKNEEEFMLKRTLLASAAALAMLAATAPAQAVSIMYAEWLSSLVEPGIAAYEKETGEKVEAIKLPGDGYVERVALDLSAGTAADVIQM